MLRNAVELVAVSIYANGKMTSSVLKMKKIKLVLCRKDVLQGYEELPFKLEIMVYAVSGDKHADYELEIINNETQEFEFELPARGEFHLQSLYCSRYDATWETIDEGGVFDFSINTQEDVTVTLEKYRKELDKVVERESHVGSAFSDDIDKPAKYTAKRLQPYYSLMLASGFVTVVLVILALVCLHTYYMGAFFLSVITGICTAFATYAFGIRCDVFVEHCKKCNAPNPTCYSYNRRILAVRTEMTRTYDPVQSKQVMVPMNVTDLHIKRLMRCNFCNHAWDGSYYTSEK